MAEMFVDAERHIFRFGEPLSVQPKECVLDFKASIFDRTPNAMMGTSASEYSHIASWFENSETLSPHIGSEGDVAPIPFLIHEAPSLRRAVWITHGREVVWRIGDDSINALTRCRRKNISAVAVNDHNVASNWTKFVVICLGTGRGGSIASGADEPVTTEPTGSEGSVGKMPWLSPWWIVIVIL